MTVRNLSPATQQSYLSAVSKLSRYFGRSPDRVHGEFVNSRANGGQNQKRSRSGRLFTARDSGAGARFNDTRVGGRAGQGAVRIGRAPWPRSRGRWLTAENRMLKGPERRPDRPICARFTNSPWTSSRKLNVINLRRRDAGAENLGDAPTARRRGNRMIRRAFFLQMGLPRERKSKSWKSRRPTDGIPPQGASS